jgi:hypothetical protein
VFLTPVRRSSQEHGCLCGAVSVHTTVSSCELGDDRNRAASSMFVSLEIARKVVVHNMVTEKVEGHA